jgi:NAD(P)-dependent dehydrogenase (short-subunit alcohol dehydrogenase family)
MDLKIAGKRALVTGSSSGIGITLAQMLAAEGAEVVVHGRDTARTRKTADSIRREGGIAHEVIGDIAEEEAAIAVAEAVNRLGGIDILVNNVGGRDGGFAHTSWFGVPAKSWINTYKQNTVGAVSLIDRLVPPMIERGWGRVINISSAIAIHQPPRHADYQSAKAALVNLTRSLSKSLAGTGVTANVISVGIILNSASEPEIAKTAAALGYQGPWRQHERDIVMKIFGQTVARVGQTSDIGAPVCFLASPQADFITGAHLVVDGGIA